MIRHTRASLFAVFVAIVLGVPAAEGRDGSAGRTSADGPKYIFYFIGDGMAAPQVHATEAYLGALGAPGAGRIRQLTMSRFPVHGMQMSYANNRFITGSAAAGTALACGIKTNINIIGMHPDGRTPCTTVAERARSRGMKVGVVTSVSLDHATPAVFYAHTPNRIQYRDIGRQLLGSGFDYFAGGGFLALADVAAEAARSGFRYVDTRSGFDGLKAGAGRVIAVNPYLDRSKSIPYELDRLSAAGPGRDYEGSITLAEFTEKGIELLENERGFFMMVEGGKIDWACHANDARAAIGDVIAFDEAVAAAAAFAERHPSETLIVVTGDHETGGMTLGFAGTGYEAYYEKLLAQAMTFEAFDSRVLAPYKAARNPAPADVDGAMWRIILEHFGLDGARLTPDTKDDLSGYETELVENAFDKTMAGASVQTGEEDRLLYGTYDPLSVTLTHLLNRKAGLAWTSYSHTAVPVPVFASGAGAEHFDGYYENTEIARRMAKLMGFEDGF